MFIRKIYKKINNSYITMSTLNVLSPTTPTETSLPWWAILLIVLGAIILAICASIGIHLAYKNITKKYTETANRDLLLKSLPN